MDIPKGGLNKGIIFPLIFSCPFGCVCKSNEKRTWYHSKCGNPSYITQYGDIICKNHLKNCSGYFLKDASFQCKQAEQSQTTYKHNSVSKLLLALSMAISISDNYYNETNDLNIFAKVYLKKQETDGITDIFHIFLLQNQQSYQLLFCKRVIVLIFIT